jgi:hypothetical protein
MSQPALRLRAGIATSVLSMRFLRNTAEMQLVAPHDGLSAEALYVPLAVSDEKMGVLISEPTTIDGKFIDLTGNPNTQELNPK